MWRKKLEAGFHGLQVLENVQIRYVLEIEPVGSRNSVSRIYDSELMSKVRDWFQKSEDAVREKGVFFH